MYDADGVAEVLAWPTGEASQGRSFTLHVATIPEDGRRPDLLWLHGTDPTIPT